LLTIIAAGGRFFLMTQAWGAREVIRIMGIDPNMVIQTDKILLLAIAMIVIMLTMLVTALVII